MGSADKTVHLWDVADPGHPVALGAPLTGPSGYVWAAAFNPSGTILAVGSPTERSGCGTWPHQRTRR